MQIYIDESGDLGFGPKASQYFVIAALIVRNDLKIKTCFKKIRQQKLRKKLRELPELKFNNTNKQIRRRILMCLAECDLDIAYALLRKSQVDTHLRDKNQIIYNYLTGSLISQILVHCQSSGTVHICIDKSLYGIQRDYFDDYLTYKMLDGNLNDSISRERILIDHRDSRKEPCIQAADFVAGAIHYRYRENDDVFHQIIEERMIIELDYFKGRKK